MDRTENTIPLLQCSVSMETCLFAELLFSNSRAVAYFAVIA
jgi:hypothetical protein